MLELLIIIVIVAAAAFYLGRRFYRSLTSPAGPDCGCSGCADCSLDPQSCEPQKDHRHP